MSDDYLVQKMAVLWTENGGDVKGYDFCIRRIRDAIDKILDRENEILDRDDVHNGCNDLAVNRSRDFRIDCEQGEGLE